MPTYSINLEDHFAQQLETLASDMGRSMEEILFMALQDFYPAEREQTDAIMAGLEDVKAGRVIPHEEVMAWAASRFTEKPLPRPEPDITFKRAG